MTWNKVLYVQCRGLGPQPGALNVLKPGHSEIKNIAVRSKVN